MQQEDGPADISDDITLVIGASSKIAIEVIRLSLERGKQHKVIAVSRSESVDESLRREGVLWLNSDYSEESMAQVASRLKVEGGQLARVFICNGMLHGGAVSPERRLEELGLPAMEELMRVNAFLPALWLKHLKPAIRASASCTVTAFSARIGSISDNGLGGWYAYRTSKAALNMLMKNAAIEFQRFRRQVRFIVFHPGTTDTPLSKPFQGNVPAGKLFTPAFVAENLMEIVADSADRPPIQFLAWDGSEIDW